MKDLKPEEIKAILSHAYDFGFKGFGGQCASAAIAINRVLFNGEGKFVMSLNESLWSKRKHFAGHVVVEYNGIYWDADGRPKSREDIEDWGAVGDDPYYKQVAKDYKIRWSEKKGQRNCPF